MTAKSSGGAVEEGMSDLTDRLRDHAALHEALTDEEQQQWGAELHEAADRIDALEAALEQARVALESIKRDHWTHWSAADVELVSAALRAIEEVRK